MYSIYVSPPNTNLIELAQIKWHKMMCEVWEREEEKMSVAFQQQPFRKSEKIKTKFYDESA